MSAAETGLASMVSGIRVVKGDPDAAELAAVVAVLCARGAASAAAPEGAGPPSGPRAAHWPRSAGGAGPAFVGWSHRPGAPWRPLP
ncbi:acyl-CoA carboxylase epsilon subunit [Streptomyces gobitricini]|uniref:Acyl-CoA carboxylase subunit epsilon n=1 Tax=Streptomyces gobitricini TaxID=68211 RepID=A0ABN3N8G6_9ACTN